jgi:hypothetical protein
MIHCQANDRVSEHIDQLLTKEKGAHMVTAHANPVMRMSMVAAHTLSTKL